MAFDNRDMQAAMKLEDPQYQPFISATAVLPESDHAQLGHLQLSPYSQWTPLKDLMVKDVRGGLRCGDSRRIYDGHVMDLFLLQTCL